MKLYPLSRTQMGIYLAGQNARGNEGYNIVRFCRLGTDIEIPQLKQALGKVFNNHAAFKARLTTNDEGMPCFSYNADEAIVIQELEMRNAEELRQQTSDFSFDLSGGPLYQLWIVHTTEDNSYWFAYVIHHLIFDGVSNAILFRELQQAYHGEELMPEVKSMLDICLDEENMRQSEAYKAAKAYFGTTFADAIDVVTYPTEDVAKPVVAVDEQWEEIEVPLVADRKLIKDMCGKYNVATDMVFYAAFGYVMSKLSNDDKALFASIYTGRTTEDTSNTMAMMVQTYPIFMDFSATATDASTASAGSVPGSSAAGLMASTLTRLSNQVKTTRQHTIYSFGEVTSELGVKPMMSIAYHGTLHDSEWRINEEKLYYEHPVKHAPGFNLSFAIVQVGNEYRIRAFHNKNLHTAACIKDICLCIDNVLRQMAEGKEFADMQLLNDEQTAEVITLSKGEKLEYDATKTPVELIMAYAKSTPDAIAVTDVDTAITYAQLDSMTNVLAHVLVDHGVQKDQFVGVMMDRSVYFPITAFAIHKAGAAYMPLDVDYPNERLSYMIENSEATVLVTTHAVLEAKQAEGGLNIDGLHIIYIEEIDLAPSLAGNAEGESVLSPICLATPDSLAYMIYTSGSTGKPKGAMLHQRGLLNFTLSIAETEQLTAIDRIASHRSFSFDAHIGDLYPILAKGGSLHIMPSNIRKDLDAMYQFIVDNKITGFGCTTSLMMLMLGNYDMPVRFVTAGGEKLSGVQSDHIRIINLYGPTECTNDSTLYAIEPGQNIQNIPIGRPVHNMTCLVMSKDGKLLPKGTPGELCITGVQVGRGYWRLPEKTAEAFVQIENEKLKIANEAVAQSKLMYRTGDLVRWNSEGQLEYLGRIDGQVKLRGFRIEMGEIESTALQVSGVKQVAAAVKEVSGNKRLVLYYTLNEGANVTDHALSDHINASSLAEYMHPEVYQHLDTMPQLPNGKIDRKHLPEPVINMEHEEAEATRELNVLEQQIVDIIEQLIGNAPAISTPLTYCGLSSILAMRLAAQLYKKFGIKMTSKQLQRNATVMTIENEILNHMMSGGEVKANESKKSTATQALLSFAQQGVYAECAAHPDTTLYNIPSEVTFPASTDVSVLKNAVERVIESHPMLFARFIENEDSDIIQVIPEKYSAKVETKEIGSQTLDAIKADFLRPYDLAVGPLYRALIVNGEKNVTLLLDTHHLASDGGSIDIIINQIVNAINGAEVEKEAYTFMNFCESQKRFAESEAFAEHKKFFAEQLANFETVTDITPDITGKDKGVQAEVAAPLPVCDIASTISGVTETHFWLAATAYALGRFTNSHDVYLTAISSGRQNLDIMDTVGMFVNTLPVSAHVSEQSVAEYIREVSDMFRATIDHENYPFAQIAADYGYTAGITFGYQLGVIAERKVNGESVTQKSFGLDVPKFRIGIFIKMKAGKPSVVLQYDDSLYSAALMQQLADSIVCAAVNMLKDIDAPVKKVSVLDDDAVAAIFQLGKGEALDYDRSETAVSLFRKQAAATPDAICVVFDDPNTGQRRSYTYHEVDELTDRMARYLTTQGVGPEQPVGVMIDRSEKIVLFPLSIMKAGGAYMPLDSHFPEDRLSFMCEDAGVKVILTEGELLKEAMPSFAGKVFTYEDIIVGADAELTAPKPENMHVILYTSGSTGKPKGVVLEQHNMANFCHWFTKNFNVTAADRVAAFANFGFDVHQADLWPILSVGGSIYVIPQDMRLDLAGLEEYINNNHLTIANITTQIGSMFAASVSQSTLRHLIVAGEKLGPTAKPDYGFNNAYGPTECTIYATNYPIEHDYDSSLIGRALTNYSVAVVDEQLNLLPLGAPGELIIMGEGVGRGYLNRPDVTAEKFITYNGQKAYRTGDQVRMMPDGQIDYMGRMDGQVKLRGLRIELGEVESAILRHPAVKAAAAAVKEIADSQHLCAYYVLKEGENATAEDIKEFMAKSVTDFMVPDFMNQLDKLPYNANGKVDRKQLPAPAPSHRSQRFSAGLATVPGSLAAGLSEGGSSAGHVWNKLQSEIRELIVKVLGIEEIGINSPLRAYGLTSLIAMKLAAQLHKRFAVKIPSKNLSGITILEIEDLLLQHLMQQSPATIPGASVSGSPAIVPGASASGQEATVPGSSAAVHEATFLEAPLTFSQQGVYMDCQMNPDSIMYNIPTVLTFPASVSAETLSDAVKKVAMNHPALFCNFFQTDHGVVMRKPSELSLDVTIKLLSDEALEAEKDTFMRPFDLEHDRLIRAEVITTPDNRKTLLLDMHHMVSDGSSMDIFIRQLIDVLNGQEIEPESYDYLRFAAEQNAKAEQGGLSNDEAFFDKMFEQYEAAANVPANKTSAEPSESSAPRQVSTPIPADIMNIKLPDYVSRAHFWFAVFNYALSRYANTKDVYTAFISSGRQDIDIADTVGMFVNTLPCAVHVKEQSVEEFIKEVSQTFSDILDHENYPFARIAADYDFKGSASFAYQLGLKSNYIVDGTVVTQSSMKLNKAKIALSIFIQHVDGVPSVLAVYDDSQYTNDLIQHFTESIVAVAEHFAADMTAKVKEISIMSERQRLEVEGMHSVHEDLSFPIRTFHEGIEQWAVKTPDALALMACDRDMTYREYNAEANQMARALMARGMKYGDRVVLLLPRRSYYLTALFAVMKSGCAFIPMDPEYPADRIAYILDDSEGRFVITTPEKVADYPGRAIDIFQLMEEAKTQPSDNLGIKVDPHDLAYLIYTSGSTGRPKGVMIEHLGAASFLTFYKSDTNFGSDSNANRVGLCQSTVSFDLSVGEIGVQVFNGDTVAFANEDEMMSPVEMIKLCRRTGAQTISGTPSRLAVNLELEEYYDLIKDQMKCVVTGGEKLPGALLDELEKMNVYIINTYGPTETTMGSSAGVLNGTREIHVGKPFTNYTYQVLDSDRNELPVGVMGELCIGGIGLARGYNNMPERTAETFIEWHGKRIYRTGDYAMWTKDGNIIIMGRTDNQVKLNGLRIELGEIETVMSQQQGMRQSVAVIKKLGNIDKLIGYYTVDETVANIPQADYEEQMRADMSEKLTPYMVPGIFVRLDEMPLTPVGKTDVKRLPIPELQSGEYVAPKNEVEKTFCEIFAKILNLKRVGTTENFFELGGTSLVAMQLIAEAAKAGYTMVYKTIFDNATPGLLARLMKPELYKGEEMKSQLPMIEEIENYDYSQLDDILAANTIDTFRNGQCYEQMGNVMLAGATGFLGIHVLHNLILRDDVPHIYCLVRSNKALNAESRLRTLLYYYFDNAYEEQFGSRIFVIEGDVTNAEVFEKFNEPLDVVINCAANVKHFSAGTDIEDINVKGCQNCIDLCLRTGARFIQTSTGSIAGNIVSDHAVAPIIFTERDLYHGQELPTKYAASKFLAERNVLDAIKNHGLKGKIMRLGNLSARSTDGEFQINFRSNNAMATLKAFQTLGCIPYERDCGYSEFSPINEVADAIIRLSLTPDGCTIFQPGNIHWPPYGDTIECMNRIGYKIERVEQEEFQHRLEIALQDANKSDLVQSLVAYKSASDGHFRAMNGWETKAHTAQILLRLGFRWSFTTWDYIENYLRCLQGLGVFDDDFRR